MIVCDGDRSLKRKWFARKKLASIIEMDIPAAAVKFDGFVIRVRQIDGEGGGRITAPVGAIVTCSNSAGIKIMVADHWLGAFDHAAYLHTVYYFGGAGVKVQKLFNASSEEEMVEDGNEIIKFKPAVYQSPYGTVDGEITGETVYVSDWPCQPAVLPFKSAEAMWVVMSDQVFIDFNGNGIADRPKYISEFVLSYYAGDCSNLGGRIGIDLQIENLYNAPWRFIQQLSKTRFTSFFNGSPDTYGGKVVVARDYSLPDGSLAPVDGSITGLTAGYTLLEEIIPAGVLPSGLRPLLLSFPVMSGPMGIFAFEESEVRTTLYVVDASDTGMYWGGTQYPELRDWFSANPDHEHWKLFFVFMVGNTSHLVHSGQFIGLLADLATIDILGPPVSYSNARRMLEQLSFVPPANHNFKVPYDTFMFRCHDGNIYTWTRKYGAVKFTSTGLFAADLVVPETADGVRPEIIYAGMFADEPLYLCVCNDIGNSITTVYHGSPFLSWAALPHTKDGDTLVYCRPVKVSPLEIMLIGVIKSEDKFYFGMLRWIPGSTGQWVRMGRLPVNGEEKNSWNTCLYGNGIEVDNLESFLSQPPVSPQTPVGPYNLYEIGMP